MKKMVILCKVLIMSMSMFFLCNCSYRTNTVAEDSIHHLHLPTSGEDQLKISDFADTVIYLPLETTKESILNGIGNLWMNDSLILISSRKIGVMQFRSDGRFVRKIGNIGKGPGEYVYVSTFSVVNDTIYIPNNRKGFVRYTLIGNFCDEIQLNYEPIFTSSTADQKLACYNQDEGQVLVYNKGFNAPDTIIVEHGVTKGRYYTSQMDYNVKPHLYQTPSGLLFNSYRSDTVWNITGNTKKTAFILNTPDKMLPYDKQIEFYAGNLDKWGEIIKAYSYFHVIPFPSFNIVFQRQWSTNFTNYQAFYLDNIKTGDIKKFNTSYILDDIVSNQKLLYNPRKVIHTVYSEEYLITSILPMDVLDYLEQNKAYNKDIPSISWVNQMKNIKEDSNPILVLMKIKK